VIRSIGKNSLESIKLTARQRRAIPLVLAAKNIEEGLPASHNHARDLVRMAQE